MKKIMNNIVWPPLIIACLLISFFLGQCASPPTVTTNHPPTFTSATHNPVQYEAASNTAQAQLTEQAQDDQILIWESKETQSASPSNCNIKGNISIDGEKIYHVPGQKYYEVTNIDPAYGERWFCTEAEARAAGWRKSNR